MVAEEGKMPLENIVIKEFEEMESKRRDNQYREVLQSFRRNTKEGSGFAIFYYKILYDDVRERLEKSGFKVKIITASSDGSPAYYITVKPDFVVEKGDKIIIKE